MADGAAGQESADDRESLLSRLRLIEERPLAERAEAFSRIHEELQRALDSGDTASTSRG